MRQALHIFRKDTRSLLWEIGISLLLVASLPLTEISLRFGILQSVAYWLLPISWALLAGRAIQAEALPGHNQFWLTRPYSRASLLGAKLMFVLAFVALPMTISDFAILKLNGFEAGQYWPGFMWELVLRCLVFAAPGVVFAVITSDTSSQFGCALLAVAAVVVALFLTMLVPESWGMLEWLDDSLLVGFIGVSAAFITVWQYARRGTMAARIITAGAVLLGFLISSVPAEYAWPLAARLSAKWMEHPAIAFALDRTAPPTPDSGKEMIEVEIPLRIDGLSQGVTPRADRLMVDVTTASTGGRLQFGGGAARAVLAAALKTGASGSRLAITMTRSAFDMFKDQLVRVHTSADFTMTRMLSTAATPRFGDALAIAGLGRCSFDHCDLPFRAPRVLAFAGPQETPLEVVSYSPFPAEIHLDALNRIPLLFPGGTTITIEEPVAHFRADFTFDNVRLADFVAQEH